MRFLFTIILIPVSSFLLPFDLFSNESIINLCGNCQHVILDKMTTKCKLFGKINLINGDIHYQSCISSRSNETQCGLNGKFYIRKIPFQDKLLSD